MAWPTSVLPSDQAAPGTRWAEAMAPYFAVGMLAAALWRRPVGRCPPHRLRIMQHEWAVSR